MDKVDGKLSNMKNSLRHQSQLRLFFLEENKNLLASIKNLEQSYLSLKYDCG
jgi:hypothetical protein